VRVAERGTEANGRVLKPCTLQYGGNSGPCVVKEAHQGGKGSWNLSNVQFLNPAGAKWAMLICVDEQQMQGTAITTFLRTLNQVATERNMRLGHPVGKEPIYASHAIERAAARPKEGILEKFLTDEVQRLEQQNGMGSGEIGLLVAVMGDTAGQNGKYVYPALKRWSHTISGIPVQCCQVSKALKVGGKGGGKGGSKGMADSPQVSREPQLGLVRTRADARRRP
jgi:hypothetical protein